ncbi:hypothetical protein RSW78_10665, partial [Escherichia coli]|nr:hypothetical protein [Escherichia coli]
VSIKNDGHYFCRAGGNRPDGLNEPVTYARRDILKNRIWERSPSIKSVSVELKTEAIRRMKNRKVVGEKVQDIADDLNVSISRLYHWLKM